MKIYISGKITGLDKEEYMGNFEKAEKHLLDYGFSVINPARVNAELPEDTSYKEYMDMSRTMLRMAEGIYLLSNWEESNGAKEEKAIAEKMGIAIYYE